LYLCVFCGVHVFSCTVSVYLSTCIVLWGGYCVVSVFVYIPCGWCVCLHAVVFVVSNL
jgi:hypothetical protein